MFRLSAKSLEILRPVHPDLYALVRRAIRVSAFDFVVFEGLRTLARQRELVTAGKSQTLDSRHLTGHAVDLVPWIGGRLVWDIIPMREIAAAMSQASIELGVPVEWGGNWQTFRDGPHHQLPRRDYP